LMSSLSRMDMDGQPMPWFTDMMGPYVDNGT